MNESVSFYVIEGYIIFLLAHSFSNIFQNKEFLSKKPAKIKLFMIITLSWGLCALVAYPGGIPDFNGSSILIWVVFAVSCGLGFSLGDPNDWINVEEDNIENKLARGNRKLTILGASIAIVALAIVLVIIEGIKFIKSFI